MPLGYRAVNKKLEIVPKEAEVVRRIFALYVELGSVGELARALEREGIRPKPRQLANGQTRTAERYTVGPLAHMLKNCMYVGEVAYRGEVYPGEHGAIVESAVFNQVQAKLSERTVARRLKRSQSPHLLTGLIFDDAGHPMSPTHATRRARGTDTMSHMRCCREGTERQAGSPELQPPRSSHPDDIQQHHRPGTLLRSRHLKLV